MLVLFYSSVMKCLVLFLTLLVYAVIGTNLVDSYKDNLCLNGLRDSAGNCVCKEGYTFHRGSCFLVNSSAGYITTSVQARPCPRGFTDYQGQCVPTTCSGTLCGSSCPPGYVLNKGFCEIQNPGCPSDTYFMNGFCYFQTVAPQTHNITPIEKIEIIPPLKVNIPVPELVDPLDPNTATLNEDYDADIEVVPDRRPHQEKGIVYNVNTVNSPTNITSQNVNNVFIHISRHKSNGAIKAVVIRNNETTIYEEEPPVKEDNAEHELEHVTTDQPQNEKCCIIVSPRICQKQQDEWVCFHRKHYRCGTFCTMNVMYLKPHRPMIHNSSLIMPPSMNYASRLQFGHCRWGVCPSVDCSGCLRGSYRCHINCYTYDCDRQGGCNFINQDDYCDDNDDELCTLVEQ